MSYMCRKGGIRECDGCGACQTEQHYYCPVCGEMTEIGINASQEVYSWFVDAAVTDVAKMLAENILRFEGVEVPLGYLDITLHRDDLSEQEKQNAAGECHIPCDVRERTVIIVDDVLYTGRTARAALEAVFAHARPRAVELAVLIDRGHRELPIRPDYVGKNVPTAKSESISVRVAGTDGEDGVYICE